MGAAQTDSLPPPHSNNNNRRDIGHTRQMEQEGEGEDGQTRQQTGKEKGEFDK